MIAVVVSAGEIEAVHTLEKDDVLIIDRDQAEAQGRAYMPDHLVTRHPEFVHGRAIVDAMLTFSEARHAG